MSLRLSVLLMSSFATVAGLGAAEAGPVESQADQDKNIPYSHEYSGGSPDFKKQLKDCLGPKTTAESILKLLEVAAGIEKSEATLTLESKLDINVYKDLNPKRYSYESSEWLRLGIVHLYRWYGQSEIRKSYITFDADEGYGESFYYYQEGLPLLAIRRKTTFSALRSAKDFEEKTRRSHEHWQLFSLGEPIWECLIINGEARGSLSKSSVEAARVYVDSLLYKYVP